MKKVDGVGETAILHREVNVEPNERESLNKTARDSTASMWENILCTSSKQFRD